jgi:hypothetical protein
MESKRIKNPYYYLFFVAYYLAIDFGEKRNPRDSALYLMTVNSFSWGISVFFLLKFFGVDFNNTVSILVIAIVSAGVNHIIFTSEFVKANISNYFFTGNADYQVKRRLVGFMLIFSTLVVLLGTALINNENVKKILLN